MRFGNLLFASKARSGPCQGRGRSHLFTQKGTLSTLPLSLQGLRGIGPPLAEYALGRMGFRALREGGGVFASKARSGPTPLRSNRLGVGPAYLHKM